MTDIPGLSAPTHGDSNLPNSNASEIQCLDLVRKEIQLHEEAQKSRSYLGRAAAWITEPFIHESRTLDALKDEEKILSHSPGARDSTPVNQKATLNDSSGAGLESRVQQLIHDDQKKLNSHTEVDGYVTGFLKSVPLFVTKRAGFLGSAAINAFDEANPSDSFGKQLLCGGLGFAKGGLTKLAFDSFANSTLSMPTKGVSMGMSTRFIDSAFSVSTYTDASTGEFKFSHLGNAFAHTFNWRAMASDAIVWSTAGMAMKGLGPQAMNTMEKSPFVSNAVTGFVFGATSGSLNELVRSSQNHESYNYSNVLKSALINGGITSLAGVTGAGINRLIAPPLVPIRQLGLGDHYEFKEKGSFEANLYEKANTSVLKIQTETKRGTGFVVSDDGEVRIVTAHHVIADENGNAVKEIGVKFPDGKYYRAVVSGEDANHDIAILRMLKDDVSSLKPLDMELSSKSLAKSSDLYGLGFANGSDIPALSAMKFKTNEKFTTYSNRLKSVGNVQPGDSGGPVFNSDGKVVGIISNKGPLQCFAIPIESLQGGLLMY